MSHSNAYTKPKKLTEHLLVKNLPGLLLCLLIATPSWILGTKYPIIGGPVLAILLGIIITTIFPKLIFYDFKEGIGFSNGVKYTSKKILQYSIILLGFEMNLYNIIKVGGQSIFVMIFTLASSFITAYFLGKALKLPSDTIILVGVGTSICGGSAIAATAPVIHAKDEDVASSISTIFLFNIIAVIIFPIIGHLLNMTDNSFGMWAGTAINDTSSVVAAGTSWSNAAGNNIALQLATIVKLTRTLMIIPITLFLAFYTAKKSKNKKDNNFSFVKIFPWFIILFLVTSCLNTFANINTELTHQLVIVGKFMIVMAMAAIGLSTNLKKLISNGINPIILGMCCWFVISVVSLIVQRFMGI